MDPVEILYSQYRQDVYRYLMSMTRDPGLSEELLSDVFYAAVLRLQSFRGDSDPKTWLFTIARNKWYDHLRRKGRLSAESMTEIYLSDYSPEPEHQVLRRMAVQRLHELLSMEEERTRKIVQMRIEGYSFYEISTSFGISEGSARVIDFRTRRKLKDQLIKEGYDETI